MQEKFGIYLNTKECKAMRVSSPYFTPSGKDWVFLSPEVNLGIVKVKGLAKEKGLVADPGKIDWGEWPKKS